MPVTRRQMMTLGAAGAVGALGTSLASSKPAAGAKAASDPDTSGILIHVLTHLKGPSGPSGPLPHTFILTLWGPDNALSGTGVGFSEGTATQRLGGGMIANCVVGVWGKIENDVLRGEGVMAYSADPEERRAQPFDLEAHLSTGFCRLTDRNMGMGSELVVEGTGTVRRI